MQSSSSISCQGTPEQLGGLDDSSGYPAPGDTTAMTPQTSQPEQVPKELEYQHIDSVVRKACQGRNYHLISSYFNEEFTIDSYIGDGKLAGKSLLNYAMVHNPDIVVTFLKYGIKPDLPLVEGGDQTALMAAVELQRLDVVRHLLVFGASALKSSEPGVKCAASVALDCFYHQLMEFVANPDSQEITNLVVSAAVREAPDLSSLQTFYMLFEAVLKDDGDRMKHLLEGFSPNEEPAMNDDDNAAKFIVDGGVIRRRRSNDQSDEEMIEISPETMDCIFTFAICLGRKEILRTIIDKDFDKQYGLDRVTQLKNVDIFEFYVDTLTNDFKKHASVLDTIMHSGHEMYVNYLNERCNEAYTRMLPEPQKKDAVAEDLQPLRQETHVQSTSPIYGEPHDRYNQTSYVIQERDGLCNYTEYASDQETFVPDNQGPNYPDIVYYEYYYQGDGYQEVVHYNRGDQVYYVYK